MNWWVGESKTFWYEILNLNKNIHNSKYCNFEFKKVGCVKTTRVTTRLCTLVTTCILVSSFFGYFTFAYFFMTFSLI